MKNIFTENIDKYGIVNLVILVALPIIIALIIVSKQDINNTTSSSSYTNSETTITTKRCQASPCPNNAETGSNYCSIHKKGKTKKCAKCGKAIWDDETFCDSCLYGSILNSTKK